MAEELGCEGLETGDREFGLRRVKVFVLDGLRGGEVSTYSEDESLYVCGEGKVGCCRGSGVT